MTNDEVKAFAKTLTYSQAIYNAMQGKGIPYKKATKYKLTEMAEKIKALEAQPCIEDYPTCTECEHYDRDKHYCPRFCQVIKDTLAEAQPSEDCISRQAVDKLSRDLVHVTRDKADFLCNFWEGLNALPSVTPQRPKGKWVEVFVETPNDPYSYGFKSHKCSKCEHSPLQISNYCPNCGAEMEVEE